MIYRLHTASAGTNRQNIVPIVRPLADTPGDTALPVEAVKLDNGEHLLGVDPSFEYHVSSRILRDGDVIVCDTGGIREAIDRRGQMYGSERMAGIVMSHHGESAENILGHILRDVETFANGEPQADDMTLIVWTVVIRPTKSVWQRRPPGSRLDQDDPDRALLYYALRRSLSLLLGSNRSPGAMTQPKHVSWSSD